MKTDVDLTRIPSFDEMEKQRLDWIAQAVDIDLHKKAHYVGILYGEEVMIHGRAFQIYKKDDVMIKAWVSNYEWKTFGNMRMNDCCVMVYLNDILHLNLAWSGYGDVIKSHSLYIPSKEIEDLVLAITARDNENKRKQKNQEEIDKRIRLARMLRII